MGKRDLVTKVETFGDVRRLLLETVLSLRDGDMDVSRGMAIAANVKVLNENIQAEIAAAKMSLATEDKAHKFGRVVSMGRRLIGDEGSDDAKKDSEPAALIGHRE